MKTVLFVGNSFVYYNDLPAMLQQLSDGKLLCGSVTRGGAFAHQYADADHELGIQLRQTLQTGNWDCVVLQDQSFNPVKDPADCRSAMKLLSALTGGAKRYFYQTWAYRDGSEKLERTGKNYMEMYAALKQTYLTAAAENSGTLVPAGDAFLLAKTLCPEVELYNADCFHPSPAGTYLVACVYYGVLCGESPLELSDIPEVDPALSAKLRAVADVCIRR